MWEHYWASMKCCVFFTITGERTVSARCDNAAAYRVVVCDQGARLGVHGDIKNNTGIKRRSLIYEYTRNTHTHSETSDHMHTYVHVRDQQHQNKWNRMSIYEWVWDGRTTNPHIAYIQRSSVWPVCSLQALSAKGGQRQCGCHTHTHISIGSPSWYGCIDKVVFKCLCVCDIHYDCVWIE